MLIQREHSSQVAEIHAVTVAAFTGVPHSQAGPDGLPVEAHLVDALRASDAWLPALSLVALSGVGLSPADPAGAAGARDDRAVVGHVVCTRATLGGAPALGLGPISVRPDHQRRGVGSALMHAVLGAADALDEPLVALLGAPAYYRRFGFRPAREFGVTAPEAQWGDLFQVRPLSSYRDELRGPFVYPLPFQQL